MQTTPAVNIGIASIDVLYREHHGWLFAWLRKKLGCLHDAADLASGYFFPIAFSEDQNHCSALHSTCLSGASLERQVFFYFLWNMLFLYILYSSVPKISR